VGLLALIAATVSYLHMHALVELHGQPGWVAALTPLSMDGMIVGASMTLLADARAGSRGGVLPWLLLPVGSVASLATNVALAEPTATGRVIAAWSSFALIAAYELLMRQVRCAADVGQARQRASRPRHVTASAAPAAEGAATGRRVGDRGEPARDGVGRELQLRAWRWGAARQRHSDGGGIVPHRPVILLVSPSSPTHSIRALGWTLPGYRSC